MVSSVNGSGAAQGVGLLPCSQKEQSLKLLQDLKSISNSSSFMKHKLTGLEMKIKSVEGKVSAKNVKAEIRSIKQQARADYNSVKNAGWARSEPGSHHAENVTNALRLYKGLKELQHTPLYKKS